MLALSHRFHGHNSIRSLYQKGRPLYSRNVKLLWQPTPGKYRVAIVVSKKVHKSAVVRNRIRRRIYSLVGAHIAEGNAGADMVFLVQNPCLADLSSEKVREEVDGLLQKISA